VIVGDANLAETATYLKVGATSIVLAMIEDDVLPADLQLANPVAAIREVSHDLTLRRTISLHDGRRATALEIQWRYLELARKYERDRGLECVGEEVGADVLDRWEATLAALEADPMSLAGQLDWVTKLRLIQGFQDRHGITWGDARLRTIDLQYHDIRPASSLSARAGLDRLTTDHEVERAITEPPSSTRAYFRGRCLQRWPDDIVAANWDSMVFDIGTDPLRRVPMMEPLRGTEAMVGRLIDECSTAAELLERLGS
jgi:proteasome accessory factor A